MEAELDGAAAVGPLLRDVAAPLHVTTPVQPDAQPITARHARLQQEEGALELYFVLGRCLDDARAVLPWWVEVGELWGGYEAMGGLIVGVTADVCEL